MCFLFLCIPYCVGDKRIYIQQQKKTYLFYVEISRKKKLEKKFYFRELFSRLLLSKQRVFFFSSSATIC